MNLHTFIDRSIIKKVDKGNRKGIIYQMQKFFAFFVLNLLFLISFSQQQFTITTYYPSPVGIYNELMVKKMSVGDTNKDGDVNSFDLPVLEGSIVFAPQTGNPQTDWPAGKEGELAYSRDEASFYYYNGSEWVRQGGGYRVCISLKCAWRNLHNPGSCCPPNCPLGWDDVGEGCVCTGCMRNAYQYYVGYCERWCCQ